MLIDIQQSTIGIFPSTVYYVLPVTFINFPIISVLELTQNPVWSQTFGTNTQRQEQHSVIAKWMGTAVIPFWCFILVLFFLIMMMMLKIIISSDSGSASGSSSIVIFPALLLIWNFTANPALILSSRLLENERCSNWEWKRLVIKRDYYLPEKWRGKATSIAASFHMIDL